MNDDLSARWQAVQQRLQQAAQAAARSIDSIQLVAVSKTQPAERIAALYALGQRQFGENYLQEALSKQQALTDYAITWHFIGPLQSNKTRPVAQSFDWVHSVDRLKLAERLSEQRPANLPPLNVCLQVNISDESSKSGVAPNEVRDLAAAVRALPNLRLRGLMAIPAPTDDPAQQRAAFAALRELLLALPSDWGLDTLSMGMTDDLDAAVLEGSTCVRIGTALFGARLKRESSS